MLYTISPCTPCWKARKYLESKSIEYEYLNIGTASPRERSEAMLEIGEHLGSSGGVLTYPIIIVDDEIIFGFDEREISEALN